MKQCHDPEGESRIQKKGGHTGEGKLAKLVPHMAGLRVCVPENVFFVGEEGEKNARHPLQNLGSYPNVPRIRLPEKGNAPSENQKIGGEGYGGGQDAEDQIQKDLPIFLIQGFHGVSSCVR